MTVSVLTRWISAGVLSGLGFLIAAAGLHWLSLYNIGDPKSALVFPMLLIGVGAGMPWGLMDGLSVSVVPKERAGMAAGIFNTARVASEGITLAIVTAILATLVFGNLTAVLPAASNVDPARIAEAAQNVIMGGMPHAATVLPEAGRRSLAASYADAFKGLLHILTFITVLSAITVLGLLSRSGAKAMDGDANADVTAKSVI